MFRGLIDDAKAAAGAVIAKYAVRASVAVPFVIAAGFGTAALTVVLIERFGATTACTIMAVGFAVVGLASIGAVSVMEQEEAIADEAAEQNDTADVVSDAAAQATAQLPLALLGTLLTSPLGPETAMGGVRMLGRNLPLVLFLVLVALLFWPTDAKEAEGEAAEQPSEPWQSPDDMDRRAA